MIPLAALAAVPQVALGALQAYQGFKGLKQLNKEAKPSYSISPELQNAYTRAEGFTNQGYTGAQEAAFMQNLNQAGNTQYQRGFDLAGGNLAGALNTGIQANRINALNQFASSDADKRMQNIQYADQLAAQMQQQQNLINESAIQDRLRREQALGQAAQSGLTNIASGLSAGLGLGLGSMGGKNVPTSNFSNPVLTNGYNTNTGALAPLAQPNTNDYGFQESYKTSQPSQTEAVDEIGQLFNKIKLGQAGPDDMARYKYLKSIR